MAKVKVQPYRCEQCGTAYSKWQGQCAECQSWNTIADQVPAGSPTESKPQALSSIRSIANTEMHSTGLLFLDRVLGGGIPRGAAILLGGEPGIGKSTLLFQMMSQLKESCLYVSSEESIDQLAHRFKKFSPKDEDGLYLLSETRLSKISDSLLQLKPHHVVIDSIQMMDLDGADFTKGSLASIREKADFLISLTKPLGITLWIVGHVNKEGELAGPKVLEHMVDTVLVFSMARESHLRVIQSQKHRFGRTGEVVLLEMTSRGLEELAEHDSYWTQTHTDAITGCALAPLFFGSRVVCVEIQALSAPSFLPAPRRSASGFEIQRLHLLLAVMEKRLQIPFSKMDIYLNVVGGLKISDPGADFAVAAALASTHFDKALSLDGLFCGEIGLTGELRPPYGMSDRWAAMKSLQKKNLWSSPWKVPAESKGVAPAIHHFSTLKEGLERILNGGMA